jgi:chromosome segregation ATPase
MDVDKLIARIEKMKIEVTSILKEVEPEAKKAKKAREKAEKAIGRLEDKLASAKPEKIEKLREQLSALEVSFLDLEAQEDGLGSDEDYPDESIVGALCHVIDNLEELVSGKGKKRTGQFVGYQKSLATK